MNKPAPFANRPCKPQVTRLDNGRIAIFIGTAYQYTNIEGARTLRDQPDAVLPSPTARERYEQAERNFLDTLNAELVETDSHAPPVIATHKSTP